MPTALEYQFGLLQCAPTFIKRISIATSRQCVRYMWRAKCGGTFTPPMELSSSDCRRFKRRSRMAPVGRLLPHVEGRSRPNPATESCHTSMAASECNGHSFLRVGRQILGRCGHRRGPVPQAMSSPSIEKVRLFPNKSNPVTAWSRLRQRGRAAKEQSDGGS